MLIYKKSILSHLIKFLIKQCNAILLNQEGCRARLKVWFQLQTAWGIIICYDLLWFNMIWNDLMWLQLHQILGPDSLQPWRTNTKLFHVMLFQTVSSLPAISYHLPQEIFKIRKSIRRCLEEELKTGRRLYLFLVVSLRNLKLDLRKVPPLATFKEKLQIKQ